MSGPIPDLWPEEVKIDVVTPLAIMRYQAGLLRKRTSNLLTAEVQSEQEENQVMQHFQLVAPGLGYYQYRLFSVQHPPQLVYPVGIKAPGILFHPVESTGVSVDYGEANTQEEFIDCVSRILHSPRTKAIIQSLI